MRKPPDKRNPVRQGSAHRVRVSSKSLAAIETSDNTPNVRALQAARLCRRFAMSFELALTVAALAYDGRPA